MKAMIEHTSGFKLSEIDLKLRGPGEVFGTRQSGIPDLKMASLQDRDMINQARGEVEDMLEEDPDLEDNPRIRKRLAVFLEMLYAG